MPYLMLSDDEARDLTIKLLLEDKAFIKAVAQAVLEFPLSELDDTASPTAWQQAREQYIKALKEVR